MNSLRRAVVDVGTNSIKLLVADVAGQQVDPVWEGSKQTRLGQGFYTTRQLQVGAIKKTADAVAGFVQKAREQKAHSIRIVATSAARDAINATELTAAIELACGLKVEVISGEEEADMAFRGVTSDPALATEPLLLLDVGGGSTEFILGCGEEKHFRHSFALGTVRLMEQRPVGDPPLPMELAACQRYTQNFLAQQVRPKLNEALEWEKRNRGNEMELQLVGTGGTASILGRIEAKLNTFDRQRLEATRVARDRLDWHLHHLWSLPLSERKKIIGLPNDKADVVLTGAVIYAAIMDQFGFFELRISTRGLRFAAVMET